MLGLDENLDIINDNFCLYTDKYITGVNYVNSAGTCVIVTSLPSEVMVTRG
jgi:hypothetical protein